MINPIIGYELIIDDTVSDEFLASLKKNRTTYQIILYRTLTK